MRHRPHSLAARTVLQRVAPERLPSAKEEMRDLLDSLWTDLRNLVRGLQDLRARVKQIRRVDERQLQALGWALIVLRSDPPAGDPATADAYLGELLQGEAAEIREEIVTLFRSLQCALSNLGESRIV